MFYRDYLTFLALIYMSNEYALPSLSNKCTFFLRWCLPHLTFMRVIMICCHGCLSLIVDSWDITRLGKTRHLFLCTQRRLTLQSGLSLSLCCSSSLDYSFWVNSSIPRFSRELQIPPLAVCPHVHHCVDSRKNAQINMRTHSKWRYLKFSVMTLPTSTEFYCTVTCTWGSSSSQSSLRTFDPNQHCSFLLWWVSWLCLLQTIPWSVSIL